MVNSWRRRASCDGHRLDEGELANEDARKAFLLNVYNIGSEARVRERRNPENDARAVGVLRGRGVRDRW